MGNEADTFEDEPSRYSKVLHLDQQAQAELAQELAEFSAWVRKIEAESAKRLAASGEEPITAKVGFTAFPLPRRPMS